MSDLSKALVPYCGGSSNSNNDVTEMNNNWQQPHPQPHYQQQQPHPQQQQLQNSLFGMGGQYYNQENQQPQPPQYQYQNPANVNHFHGSNFSFYFNTAGVYDVNVGMQDSRFNNNGYRYGEVPVWGDNNRQQQQQQQQQSQSQQLRQQMQVYGGLFSNPTPQQTGFSNPTPQQTGFSNPTPQQTGFFPQQSGCPSHTSTPIQGPSGTMIRPTELSPPPQGNQFAYLASAAAGYNMHQQGRPRRNSLNNWANSASDANEYEDDDNMYFSQPTTRK